MRTMLITTFVLVLCVLSLTASAQAIDKVILVTDIASVDSLVASAAGSKDGLPVLVLQNGELTSDIKAELTNLSAKTIIIVGGPSVVKQETAQELQSLGYNVTRLWGIERTETAIEVTKHFWPEGANCSVLVDDTSDPATDTDLLAYGSGSAVQSNCPLIPIPKGKMPAAVLAQLRELGVKKVKWFGQAVSAEVREALKEFSTTEVVGESAASAEAESDASISASKKPLKMVIVAAPNWKAVVGIGGQPNERSVVRIVSNASQASELVSVIKQKNITDVKVVGFPALAQDIAAVLANQSINVTKISGEHASDVAKAVLENALDKWQEKRTEAVAARAAVATKIKAKIASGVNETEVELAQESENIAELSLDASADISTLLELKQKITEAKSKLADVEAALAANDTERAKELLAELREQFQQDKWLVRERIKWDWQSELSDENADIAAIDSELSEDIESARASYKSLKAKCPNALLVQKVVEEAHALRQAAKSAKDERNYSKAAELLQLAKANMKTVSSVSAVCKAKSTAISASTTELINERRSAVSQVSEVSTQVAAIEKLNETSMETAIAATSTATTPSVVSSSTTAAGESGGATPATSATSGGQSAATNATSAAGGGQSPSNQ